ncbi:MAG: chloride channel protein [Lachnospiraceae bacterium]|nr:chloride channel protein [Lachnospiraceae bacterium]
MDIKRDSKEVIVKCIGRVVLLFSWAIRASLCGLILGVIGGMFSLAITNVTGFRNTHPWMLYLLPVGGLAIVAMYKLDKEKRGTNRVLEAIQSGEEVSITLAPLIMFSTIITHAFGGSAGREGAALQLGGSIGENIGNVLQLDEADKKIMIMCGMSAAFSALFGTPLTATIFAMEVVSVGIMQYAALVPCSIAAIIGKEVSVMMGAHGEHFPVPGVTRFTSKNAIIVIVLAFLCAAISIIFCEMLHRTEHLFKTKIENEWLRVVAGAVLVIVLTKLIGTTDYLGAGMNVIEAAISGEVIPIAFLMKMIFTSISLGSGFRGGEIVPTLFVGATFGCLFGQIVGFNPALAAACGMTAVFCGVTNCPISSLFLSFELFGFGCMPFFLLCVGVSYMESGYSGLYHSQKILYSKTRLKYINTKTK